MTISHAGLVGTLQSRHHNDQPDAQADFAGLIDIRGGRRIYLECRGTGSPSVVLEAGYRSSTRIAEASAR
jgi:hypothetical protein